MAPEPTSDSNPQPASTGPQNHRLNRNLMSNSQTEPDLGDEIAIPMETLLDRLTEEQVEMLRLGLVHNFHASIDQPPEIKRINCFMLTVSSGQVVAIDATCTIKDVWNLADAAQQAGGLPWNDSGINGPEIPLT